MSEKEKEIKNRVVVTNEIGEITKIKTDAEIVKENEEFEKSLQPKIEKPKLDPDILKKLKQKQEEKDMKAVGKRDRSIYFGFIGVGQCGNRLAELTHKLGYESLAFNTANQDLEYIDIPKNKKIFLPYALGGAGKLLENGKQAIDQNEELILNKLNETFGDEHEILVFICSGSGGSGSGGSESMINLMATLGKPIMVIYVLPMDSEDSLAKHNTVTTLSKLAKMANSGIITSLIVADNAKIDLIYPNLSKAEFWNTANNAILEPLHLFNHLSSEPSNYDSLDSMDFARIISTPNCLIYGTLKVFDYMETTSLAEAILDNLESGLLASDFDLSETKFGGYIVTAPKRILEKIPATNFHYATHILNEKCNSAHLVNGVYEVESNEDCLKVYTLLAGLGLPSPRVDALISEASEQMEIMKQKENNTSNMQVSYGANNDTQAQSKKVHDLIKQKKSAFGKLTSSAGRRIVDKRKR